MDWPRDQPDKSTEKLKSESHWNTVPKKEGTLRPPLHHEGEDFKKFLRFTSILFSERYEYLLCSLRQRSMGLKYQNYFLCCKSSYIFTHSQNTKNSVVSNDLRNADKVQCYLFNFWIITAPFLQNETVFPLASQ